MTAREQLVTVLGELKEARQSLDRYKADCLRAQQIEKESLADQSLSEDEAVDRIAKAQARIEVHEARIADRQAAVTGIEKQMMSLILPTPYELRSEYETLLDSRAALLKGRVLEVLKITDVAMVPSLSQILHRSPLLSVTAQCHPPQINPNVSSEQQAQDLLNKFEVLAKKKAKSI
jgi:hypothetical protein